MDEELTAYVAESRRRILGEAYAIGHSLVCEECGLQWVAYMVLALAGWDQDDFNQAWAAQLSAATPGA